MLWCLFRHTAAQAFRDLVVRMGDRVLFRRMSYTVAERVAKQIGVKISQRTFGKGVSRWLPVVGALGVGAYAYYDTGQVAATAIELFSGTLELEAAPEAGAAAAAKAPASTQASGGQGSQGRGQKRRKSRTQERRQGGDRRRAQGRQGRRRGQRPACATPGHQQEAARARLSRPPARG